MTDKNTPLTRTRPRVYPSQKIMNAPSQNFVRLLIRPLFTFCHDVFAVSSFFSDHKLTISYFIFKKCFRPSYLSTKLFGSTWKSQTSSDYNSCQLVHLGHFTDDRRWSHFWGQVIFMSSVDLRSYLTITRAIGYFKSFRFFLFHSCFLTSWDIKVNPTFQTSMFSLIAPMQCNFQNLPFLLICFHRRAVLWLMTVFSTLRSTQLIMTFMELLSVMINRRTDFLPLQLMRPLH